MAEDLEGDEPDARFTYANERTFLAWNRTALALMVTGVAATQLLPALRVARGRQILGLPLLALGALVAVMSYLDWRRRQHAMRVGAPLPRSHIPIILVAGISVMAVVAVVLAIVET